MHNLNKTIERKDKENRTHTPYSLDSPQSVSPLTISITFGDGSTAFCSEQEVDFYTNKKKKQKCTNK